MWILRLLLLASLFGSVALTDDGPFIDPNGASADYGAGIDPNGSQADAGPRMDPNG